MSLCSRVCSTVNCHRYCADGDTLLCQIVNALKDLVVWLSPKAVDKPVTNLSHYPANDYNWWSEVKLTTNWPTFLPDNFKLPETVDEAVDRLMMVLDGEQKITIATLQEDDLINLHFSLATGCGFLSKLAWGPSFTAKN